MTPPRADVFLSYRHREPHATWVRETLAPALEAEGYSVIVDVTDFTPGRSLVDDMERAAQARLTVAVIDSSYRESGFVHFERLLASRLIAVMRDPVDGLVAPGTVETVDLVGRDDPRPVLEAVHRVVRRVFILESEEDEEWVEGVLIPALDNSGVSTEHNGDLEYGDAWKDAVTLRLLRADRVVIVLSSAYLRDLHPRADDLVNYVETKERRSLSLPLRRELDLEIPPRYEMLNPIDASRAELWEAALTQLCKVVGVDLAPPSRPPPCPYPGMRPFSSDQAELFVGRDDEIGQILSGLRRERFVALIGPSASGKSSLAIAGVGPTVAAHGLDGRGPWMVETIRPGRAPLTELGQAVDRWRTSQASTRSTPAQPLLLIVDQLEEIWHVDGPAAFEAELVRLVEDPNIHVIVTVRADFYPQLMSGCLWPLVNTCRIELVPLTGRRLRDAIRAPARTCGVVVAEALVERLAADTEGQPGLLPFLQEMLVTLWGGLRYRYLTLDAYERTSDRTGTPGIHQAIRGVAESAVGRIEARHPGGRRIVRNILVRLVQFGEGRPHTRRRVPVTGLRSAAPDDDTFQSVFDALVESRLVTTDKDSDDVLVADLSHEAIINGWPALAQWVDERRSAEDSRRRLLAEAQRWAQRVTEGEPEVGLLEDVELEEAQRWLAGAEADGLGEEPLIRRHVEASAAAARRRRRRRRVATLGTFAALVVVAAVLAVAAVTARQAQRDAERASVERLALQLRASSAELGDEALPLRALLVRAADRLDATPVSRVEMLATVERRRLIAARIDVTGDVAFDAMWADNELVAIGAGDGEVSVRGLQAGGRLDPAPPRTFDVRRTPLAIARRPGTNVLAVGGCDGTPEEGSFAGRKGAAYLIDLAETPLEPRRLPLDGESPVSALAFTGDTLLAGRWEGTIAVVDVAEATTPVRRVLEIPRTPEGAPDRCTRPEQADDLKVRSIAVDHTGRWVAAATNNCLIAVWDFRSNEQSPRLLLGHTDKVRALAFVPSTATLLSAGDDRSIRRWDIASPAATGTVLTEAADEQRVLAMCVAPDGRSVVTAGRDHSVRRWSFDGNELSLDPVRYAAHAQTIRALACPSSLAFASLGADGLVMWDLGRPPRSGHALPVGAGVNALAVRPGQNPDVAVAASAGQRGIVVVERRSGAPQTIELGKTFPLSMAYNAEGSVLAVAGDQPGTGRPLEGVAVVYDADSLAELGRVAPVSAQTMRAVAVRDAENHAVGDDGGAIYLSVDGSPVETRTATGFGVRALSYTPNGNLLVGDEYGALYCYDPNRPERPLGRIDLGRPIASIAVGRDGSVAAGTADGFVAVFVEALSGPSGPDSACDPHEWTRINLATASDAVTSVALLANGSLGVFGTRDAVELWDVVHRRQIGGLAAGRSGGKAFAAGDPGATTIAVGANDLVDVYPLDREDLRRGLCRLAGRQMTADELAAFLPDPGTRDASRCDSAESS
jgi:WD40 repeat protein